MKFRVTLDIELSDEKFKEVTGRSYAPGPFPNMNKFIHQEITGWLNQSFNEVEILNSDRNYTQEEFLGELYLQLKKMYYSDSENDSFGYMGGLIDGRYFSIEQEINEPYNIIVNGYASDYDFEEGDNDDTGGCIVRMLSRSEWEDRDDWKIDIENPDFEEHPTDEQIMDQAQLALELLGITIDKNLLEKSEVEPTELDIIHIDQSVGK